MTRTRRGLLAAALALSLPASGWGAGFAIFEMGTKATGLGGAFTATADDPSAMFYNPAGLGFQTDRPQAYAGSTLIAPTSEFTGQAPYPGPSATGEMENNIFTPIGLYYAHPINESWVAGIGVFTAFGLGTEWQDPDTWSGRFVSQRADLQTVSIQPTVAWKYSEQLSFGLGLEYRGAMVELERNAPVVNPYTQSVVDAAHVSLESDGIAGGWGFSLGILYKPTEKLRAGLSYRHHIDIDLDGEATFDQIPTGYADLDAAIASRLPFGEPAAVETSVAFPSMASVGVAYDVAEATTVEVNANWTGWNRFESLPLHFPDNPELSDDIYEGYQNVWQFRLGLEHRLSPALALRCGWVYDNTPQPKATVSPLLPDADRTGYSIGLGWTSGNLGVDLAYMYLDFRDSFTAGTSTSGFEGHYENTAHLLGFHARYRF